MSVKNYILLYFWGVATGVALLMIARFTMTNQNQPCECKTVATCECGNITVCACKPQGCECKPVNGCQCEQDVSIELSKIKSNLAVLNKESDRYNKWLLHHHAKINELEGTIAEYDVADWDDSKKVWVVRFKEK